MKTYFKQILCVLFVLSSKYVFSQFGTTCATATSVNVNICNGLTVGTVPASGVSTTGVPTSSLCANTTTNGIRTGTDGWISFTTDPSSSNISHTITLTTPAGQTLKRQNLAFELYKGPCPGTYVGCQNSGITNPETMNSVSLQPSTTYYIRAVNIATSTVNTAGNQVIPITNVTVSINGDIVNDEIGGAIPLTVQSSTCVLKTIDLCKATSSSCAPAPTCGNYVPTTSAGNSKDLWYSVTVPASGNFFIQTQAGTGTGAMTNAALAVYSSSVCGSASILGCSEGNPSGVGTYSDVPMSMPSLYISGASPGTKVYVRIWNENGYSPGTFGICVNDMGPCGNLPTNDFCSNAAPITTSGATISSIATNTTTGITYTEDHPGDIDVTANVNGCIYPGYNSWYSFIATTSGLTIPFQLNTASCTGLEAAVYNVTKNANGCCKNFTQLSDCNGVNYDPITDNTFTVTVPPGSLITGNTYYLMINNFEVVPSACSFSVTGWAVTGVLPVELVSFIGNNEGKYNVLEWITASEKNVEFYTLEHSPDAINFMPITTVAAENTQQNVKYKVNDENPYEDVTYYRIKQKDKDGNEKYTNTISVSLKNLYDNIYNIHPNPTNSNLNFEFYSKTNNSINIELLSYAGASVLKLHQSLEEGKNNITLPMNELDKGVYILKVVSEKSGKTTHNKIIKN